MVEISDQLMRAALDAAPEGFVICAAQPPEHPVLYVNPAFLRLSGCSCEELLGHDLRVLEGAEHGGEGHPDLRTALARAEACRVQLRALRRDGAQVWLELLLQPLPGNGAATPRHFMGVLRELSERERPPVPAAAGLASWLREDRLSGLCSRAYFEQLLQRDWQIGLREERSLTLLAFDIDELGTYNGTYGRAAGDACIRRIAGVIGSSFRRGSDLVSRWQGGCILALMRNCEAPTIPAFARCVVQKVLDQHIHHPRAQRQKFVCVSVGAATITPDGKRSADSLVAAALRALKKAKQDRHVRIAIAGPAEID